MLKMVKKQGEATAVKVSKTKVAKSSSWTRVGKSQSSKVQAKSSSSKRPAKSLPGFSLYSSGSEADVKESKEKSSVRWKRNGEVQRESAHQSLKAAGDGDDVVSQVQLLEKAGGFEGLGIYIPTARVESPEPKALSPELTSVQDVPNMNTPFNKRLLSSTPDPERLMEADVIERLSAFEVPSKTTTDAAPQMIPERETFDSKAIASMPLELATGLLDKLKQQRQNLRWQQQLHQCKVKGLVTENFGLSSQQISNMPVHTAVSHLDTLPSDSSIVKAKTDLAKADLAKADIIQTDLARADLDKKDSTKVDFSKTESVKTDLILEKPIKHILKAEWVQGSKMFPVSQPKETAASPKQSWERIGLDERKNPPAYNGYGVTSSQSSVTEVISLVSELPSPDPPSIPSTNVEIPRKMNSHTNNVQINEHYQKFSAMKQISNRPKSLSHIESQSKRKTAKTNMTGKVGVNSKGAAKPQAKKNQKGFLDAEADERGKERWNSFEDVPAAADDERKAEDAKPFRPGVHSPAVSCDEEVNSLIRNLNFPETNTVAITEGEKPKNSTTFHTQENIQSVHKSLSSSDETEGRNSSTQEKIHKDVLSEKILPAKEIHKALEQEEGGDAQDCDAGTSEHYKLLMVQNEADGQSKNDTKSTLSLDKGIFVGTDTDGKNSGEENTNQNYNWEDFGQGSTPRQHKLKYLEKMADPRLRDIACRLTLKAAADRDVELRDLIDDMIFHTDATLAHEEARFHASQLFFAQENNKLKKRLHTVNQQMEAKERQEKTRDNGLDMSDNEVHLQRKNQYLQEEKERLDNQVSVLLEEKARWLITQQDLVRTISLKDHETLKLEQKQHEEKTALHQAVEHAASKSQGMHYKLSVADREISNLEQRIKVKDREIGDLRDKVQKLEERLRSKESVQVETEREVLYLQDLVSSLKEGVDQALKAYDLSAQNQGTASDQQKGMDTLRQIVYSSRDIHPTPSQQFETTRTVQFHPEASAQPLSLSSSSRAILPQVQRMESSAEAERQKVFSQRRRHRSHQEEHQGQSQWTLKDISLRSRHGSDEDIDGGANILTSEALTAHNLRHSPVDHSLWRSLDDGPPPHHHHEQETYHSDSEILVNTRDLYRSQCGQSPGASTRNGDPMSRPSGKEHDVFDENWDSRRKSQTAVRSEQPRDTRSDSKKGSFQRLEQSMRSAANGKTKQTVLVDHLLQSSGKRDDSYYSTLRSKSISHPSGLMLDSSRQRKEGLDRRASQMRESERRPVRESERRQMGESERRQMRESERRQMGESERRQMGESERRQMGESERRQMRESEKRQRSRVSSLDEDHLDAWASQQVHNISAESKRRNRSSESRRRDLTENTLGESFGSERQRQKSYHDEKLEEEVEAVPSENILDEENDGSKLTAADYVRQMSGQYEDRESHSPSFSGRELLSKSVRSSSREGPSASVHRPDLSVHRPDVHRPDLSVHRPVLSVHRQLSDPSEESTKYFNLQSRSVPHPSTGTTKYSSLQSKSISQPSSKSTQRSREGDSEFEGHDEQDHHRQRRFSPGDDSFQEQGCRWKWQLSSSSPGHELAATFTSLERRRDQAEPLHSISLPEPHGRSSDLDTINFTHVSPGSKSYSSPGQQGSIRPRQEQNNPQASQGLRHLLGSFKRPAHLQEPLPPVQDRLDERSLAARTLPGFVERDARVRDSRISPPHFSPEQQEHPSRFFDRRSDQPRPGSQEWEDSPRRDNEHSFSSDFYSGRTSIPTQSSPREISVSRRATRPSDNFTQTDFFQGTELSTSFSSISEDGQHRNNNQLMDIDEDPFSTGIASLDSKIARLQAKINHTKAVFS